MFNDLKAQFESTKPDNYIARAHIMDRIQAIAWVLELNDMEIVKELEGTLCFPQETIDYWNFASSLRG